MVFSSITFLFYFLPIVLAIYYIVPKKIQWWVLLAASVVFYADSGIDDLLIVVGDVQLFGKPSSKLASAASKLASDGYDPFHTVLLSL